MKKIVTVLLLVCGYPGMNPGLHALYDPQEPIAPPSKESVDEGNTLRWRAWAFAGTALVAVVAGIAAIAITKGTSVHVPPTPPHPPHPPLIPCTPNLICPVPEGTPLVPAGTLVPIPPAW